MIIPLGDRVCIEVIRNKLETESGVLLVSEDKTKVKTTRGKVLSIGDDVKKLNVGDIIIFPNFAVTEIDVDGDTICTISEPLVIGYDKKE